MLCAACIHWLVQYVKGVKRAPYLWLSIAMGNAKDLDKVGKSSAKGFTNINEDQILRFIEFEVFHNTLFCMGRVILEQGSRGVPIGGFTSAQIAEIWCCWKEHCSLGDKDGVVTLGDKVNEVLPAQLAKAEAQAKKVPRKIDEATSIENPAEAVDKIIRRRNVNGVDIMDSITKW